MGKATKAAKAVTEQQAAFAKMPETTGQMKVERPQTGMEYIESLRDGREVFIYGERVKDVTVHPAFRNTARMVARLFDALHNDRFMARLI